jgi:hypothetical protein
MRSRWGGGGGGEGQLQAVLFVDAISISNHMAKHRSAVSVFCRLQNVGSAGRQQQPAHENERRGALDAAAAMRSNGPENQVFGLGLGLGVRFRV